MGPSSFSPSFRKTQRKNAVKPGKTSTRPLSVHRGGIPDYLENNDLVFSTVHVSLHPEQQRSKELTVSTGFVLFWVRWPRWTLYTEEKRTNQCESSLCSSFLFYTRSCSLACLSSLYVPVETGSLYRAFQKTSTAVFLEQKNGKLLVSFWSANVDLLLI